MATLEGVVQDPQVEADILLIVWEAQFKAYAAANLYSDTDYQSLGPIRPGTLEVPEGDTVSDEITGLPGGIKKSVVTETEQSVSFQLPNIEDRGLDVALGSNLMVPTYGTATTINDASPAADTNTLTSVVDMEIGTYLEINSSGSTGTKHYGTISAISGSDVTVTPTLGVTPANGSDVKVVLRSDHAIGGMVSSEVSLRLIGTDQNSEQHVFFLPRVRMELAGSFPIDFGDGSAAASLTVSGKSIGLSKAVGGVDANVHMEHHKLSGDYKLSGGPLQGLVAQLNAEANTNWFVSEAHWKEQADAAAFNDATWLSLGDLEMGSISLSAQHGRFDYRNGLPKSIKASVFNSIGFEAGMELSEVNARNIELVHAGNRIRVDAPSTFDQAVFAGSSTTVIVVSQLSNGFTNGKLVSVRRAAGTGWEKRTITAVTSGTPSITVGVALGGIPANDDEVRQGVIQEVAASPTPTTTVFAVESGTDFAAGDDLYVVKGTGTTVATNTSNSRTRAYLTSATGFAAGDLAEFTDIAGNDAAAVAHSNKVEVVRIKSLNGTQAELDPGLTFTPAVGDLVRVVLGISQVQTKATNTLTLSIPLSAAPATGDDVVRLDDVAMINGGAAIRHISLRLVFTSNDEAKQIVVVIPKFRLEQNETAMKNPGTEKNASMMLKGKSIPISKSFNSVTILEAARVHILRTTQKITA